MSFELNLDAIVVEEREMGPLPAGSYECIVEDATVSDTKKGDKMLKVTYRVVGGDHQNSCIWDYHLLTHSNPDVVRIGMEGIKKLANAVGVAGKMTDPSVLADNQTLVAVTVSVRKSEEWGDSNQVKRVSGIAQSSLRSADQAWENRPLAKESPFKF